MFSGTTRRCTDVSITCWQTNVTLLLLTLILTIMSKSRRDGLQLSTVTSVSKCYSHMIITLTIWLSHFCEPLITLCDQRNFSYWDPGKQLNLRYVNRILPYIQHGTAPPYMTSQFTRVADMSNQRRLRSASFNQLDVPSFCLPSVGSRASPSSGAKVWNILLDDVSSAPSWQPSGAIWRHTYFAAVTTLTDTACPYSDYSGPRGGDAA